jgi:phosphoserine phosphatase RsbU/P
MDPSSSASRPPHASLEAAAAPGEIALGPGDRLLVYTDGASEVCGPAGVELGVGGLAEILAGSRVPPLTDALDALLDHIRRHCAGRPLDDDVTLLLVERSGELPAAAAAGARGGPGAVT